MRLRMLWLLIVWVSSSHSVLAAWPEPTIPLVYVSEGYRSPNDTQTFGGRDYDIADKDQAELAVQALTALGDARGVVAAWYRALKKAEEAFWQDYSETGQVDSGLRDELGYWLRKRDNWISGFKSGTMMTAMQGGSYGADFAKILEWQFGVNNESFFGYPADWQTSPAGPIASAPGFKPGKPGYPVSLGEWSRYSYMTACPCSPRFSPDPIERVGYLLAHPSGDIAFGASVVQRLRHQPAVMPAAEIEGYVREAVNRYGYAVRSREIVAAILDGDSDPVPGLMWAGFDRHTSTATSAIQFVDLARASARQDRITPSSFEFEWARGRPVLLGTQSIENVEDCVVENWDEIKTYVYETNPDVVLRKTVDVYDKQSVLFKKSLGHVAAIACTSPDGLADPRVDDFMEFYGLFE